ncbi:MAG: 30S ribosomal protein S24e [Candidatus Woesearchaeota archaeon]
MNLEIIKEKDNPLLSRKRVTLEGESDSSTPSRLSIKEFVAKKVKTDSSKIAIRHVYTDYGSKKIKVIAHVYENEEDLKNTEEKSSIKRNTPPKKEEGEASA